MKVSSPSTNASSALLESSLFTGLIQQTQVVLYPIPVCWVNEKKNRELTQNCSGNQTSAQWEELSESYFLFWHIGWLPASAQKWKSTHNKASLLGWDLSVKQIALNTQLVKINQWVGEGHICSLQTPCTQQCPVTQETSSSASKRVLGRCHWFWISVPGKGWKKGGKGGKWEVREVLDRIRQGQMKSSCMLGESHSSENKWRAFPSIYERSFHLHHQTSFQVQIFPKLVACKPATLTVWFIPDNLPLQYATCLLWQYGNP